MQIAPIQLNSIPEPLLCGEALWQEVLFDTKKSKTTVSTLKKHKE